MSKVEGIDKMLRALVEKKVGMERGAERGLIKAGLLLQRASQKMVPVLTGNLKRSAFTRRQPGTKGFETVVHVGYTAEYAIYVHEARAMKLRGQPRPKKRGKYWDPQSTARAAFLEEPIQTMRGELVRVIESEMKRDL